MRPIPVDAACDFLIRQKNKQKNTEIRLEHWNRDDFVLQSHSSKESVHDDFSEGFFYSVNFMSHANVLECFYSFE